MKQVFGEPLWLEINERSAPPSARLWAYTEPLTLESFRRAVALAPESRSIMILREFLNVEPELPDIKHLPSVLSWHQIIFEAFPSGLSREEAKDMTNNDVISRLPANRRGRGRAVLDKFCAAWNVVLPKIDLMFGCQENPFRDPKGQQ